MLVFVIPVKHPASSRRYGVVCELLRQTLRSVEAQTDPQFATVIVCNERPSWAENRANRLFVEVDFPPAERPANNERQHNWVYLDKGCKIAVSLLHAQRFNPTHVMMVDADDFVSNRLAAFVRRHPRSPGWYMPRGYAYSGLFRIAEPRDQFWSYCGTSHILKSALLPVPAELGLRPSREALVETLDRFYLTRVLGDHVSVVRYFEQQGVALEPLPFVGAIWHTDTGENSSREWWRQVRFGPIWGRPLTAECAAEFAVPELRRRASDSLMLYGWRVRSTVARAVKRLAAGLQRGSLRG